MSTAVDQQQRVLKALKELFGDTSVDPHETLSALEEIEGELEGMIGAIRDDLRRLEQRQQGD